MEPPEDAMGICGKPWTRSRLPESTEGGFAPILFISEGTERTQLTSTATNLKKNNKICSNSHKSYSSLSADSVPGTSHILSFISIHPPINFFPLL